jgi:hypothetical protein
VSSFVHQAGVLPGAAKDPLSFSVLDHVEAQGVHAGSSTGDAAILMTQSDLLSRQRALLEARTEAERLAAIREAHNLPEHASSRASSASASTDVVKELEQFIGAPVLITAPDGNRVFVAAGAQPGVRGAWRHAVGDMRWYQRTPDDRLAVESMMDMVLGVMVRAFADALGMLCAGGIVEVSQELVQGVLGTSWQAALKRACLFHLPCVCLQIVCVMASRQHPLGACCLHLQTVKQRSHDNLYARAACQDRMCMYECDVVFRCSTLVRSRYHSPNADGTTCLKHTRRSFRSPQCGKCFSTVL